MHHEAPAQVQDQHILHILTDAFSDIYGMGGLAVDAPKEESFRDDYQARLHQVVSE